MPTNSLIAPTLPGFEPPSVRVAFLGSGSSGNCTAVAFGETLVLLDCGFSARETKRRLEVVGLGALPVAGLLLTHDHGDHVAGLRVLAKRHGMPVYASAGTWRSRRIGEHPESACVTSAEDRFAIGGIAVRSFRASHDTAEPLGYVLEVGGRRIGVCTDSGQLTEEAAEALRGCDLLGIEANHDLEMLQRGPYPAFLKRRILSARGHLSNGQACAAIEQLACDRLTTVVGLHLSRTNNAPELARRALVARAAGIGLGADVFVASQFEPLVCELSARV